jgi:alkanesulfonate monooxygenase SsuD/methylene tetrahydromethanopterin reductase-like flavin-dependent oxidoreductase (luciferase family)
MLKLGYKLMSEEHGPTDLVKNAQLPEKAGFDFAAISVHFFPRLESLSGSKREASTSFLGDGVGQPHGRIIGHACT